jgi:cysteine synthase B
MDESKKEAMALSIPIPHLARAEAEPLPAIYDEKLADGDPWIETEDAYRMVRRLARDEGLPVGISSGCNVHAATLLARDAAARGKSAIIVTVLCDSAEK